MKDPEAFLEDKVILPDQDRPDSEAASLEQAFLIRYFSGAAGERPLSGTELAEENKQTFPAASGQTEVPDQSAAQMQILTSQEASDQARLPDQDGRIAEEQSKFVGFFVHGQEYVVPINDVQEVIKRMQPARIPLAPEYVSGVVNLRGKVTPLVDVSVLMGRGSVAERDKNFIIVCRERDLQLGLEVERISTMYHVEQENIEWSMEAHLEGQDGFLAGLIKGESLIGIIDVKAMADAVIQDR